MYNAAASWKMHYFLYNKHELFCKREFLTMQQGHLQEQLQMNWSEVCFRIFSPLEHFLIPLFQFSLLCFNFFFYGNWNRWYTCSDLLSPTLWLSAFCSSMISSILMSCPRGWLIASWQSVPWLCGMVMRNTCTLVGSGINLMINDCALILLPWLCRLFWSAKKKSERSRI